MKQTLINALLLTGEMKPTIGGQAVLEGVMMRSSNYYATAVRNEKGKIVAELHPIRKKPKWTQIPFFRGIFNLFEMLIIGIKSLTWSADQLADDPAEKMTSWQLALTLIVSIGFSLLLFLALPYGLTSIFGISEEGQPILFNVIDGIIKILILIGYIAAISLMADIRRLFQYHGAEHKAVHCFENKLALIPKNAQKFSRLHPRCGTSFLFLVMFISVFVFAFIPLIAQAAIPSFEALSFWARKSILFVIRLLLVPLVAGISYEFLRLTARNEKSRMLRIFAWPGLMLQHITTKEPDLKQLEVALCSMKLVLDKDRIEYRR